MSKELTCTRIQSGNNSYSSGFHGIGLSDLVDGRVDKITLLVMDEEMTQGEVVLAMEDHSLTIIIDPELP